MEETKGTGLGALVLVALAQALVGCSSAPPDGALLGNARKASNEGATPASVNESSGLPCDVDAVLRERCQTCHGSSPVSGAKTSLVTWDDLHAPGVLDLVKARIHDDLTPMPPSPKPRLDAGEAKALDAWLGAGAQRSEDACEAVEVPPDVKPLSCKPDALVRGRSRYEMRPGAPTDQYVCVGYDMTLAKKKHIVGFAPKIDNAKIVHHVLLFQSDQAVSGEPFLCPAAGLAPWKLVAGWNPGANNLELPPEAGFPAEQGTTHWVLQMHYNNTAEKTGSDQSGYELCTTEELRKHDAGIAAFGSVAFTIPPRSTHTIRCDYPLGSEWNGARFFNASPHMHDYGVAMSGERVPKGGGKPERFLDEREFSFDAQQNHPVSVGVGTGDVIRTRCTWKNTSDAFVGYGESSASEMCFDFIGYYPRIASLPWVSPAVATTCVAE